jgi:ATP-dependent Clp protease ATP-binding subunit ClpA
MQLRLEVALKRHCLRAVSHHYSQDKFTWVRPACEEAARLGGGAVTERDLLLGLLADEQSSACQLMARSGLDLRALRNRLEQRHAEGEGFTETARLVLERAAEAANSLQPHEGHMLGALASVLGTELILKKPRIDISKSVTIDDAGSGLRGLAGMLADGCRRHGSSGV